MRSVPRPPSRSRSRSAPVPPPSFCSSQLRLAGHVLSPSVPTRHHLSFLLSCLLLFCYFFLFVLFPHYSPIRSSLLSFSIISFLFPSHTLPADYSKFYNASPNFIDNPEPLTEIITIPLTLDSLIDFQIEKPDPITSPPSQTLPIRPSRLRRLHPHSKPRPSLFDSLPTLSPLSESTRRDIGQQPLWSRQCLPLRINRAIEYDSRYFSAVVAAASFTLPDTHVLNYNLTRLNSKGFVG